MNTTMLLQHFYGTKYFKSVLALYKFDLVSILLEI